METETLLLLTMRLAYVTEVQARPVLDLVTEIAKMLNALHKRLVTDTRT